LFQKCEIIVVEVVGGAVVSISLRINKYKKHRSLVNILDVRHKAWGKKESLSGGEGLTRGK
jgi:hypothetical protein